MFIHGEFTNKQGQRVRVEILTGQDRTTELEIGTEEAGLWFTAEDPVVVESEVNDTFDVLLPHSCTVRLLSRQFRPEFFCTSCREAVVNVRLAGRLVFAGFIEPMALSQPYNDALDELELSCIDALSALQYSKYKDVGAAGVIYEELRLQATIRTFRDIAEGILTGIASGIDLSGGQPEFLWDMSKGMAEQDRAAGADVLSGIAVNDLLFLGDTEDDAWTQQDVLAELLRYLDLHIVQEGGTFRVFSWETLKANGSAQWHPLFGGGQGSVAGGQVVELGKANAADCDTKLSIGEVYNQLLLTCNVKDVEELVESPLDGEALEPVHDKMQTYFTEYKSGGTGSTARAAFRAMVVDGLRSYNYNASEITDWYVRLKDHPHWKFMAEYRGHYDLVADFAGEGEQALPNFMSRYGGCAIMAMGKNTIKTHQADSSPSPKISMQDYLVLGVNGNGDDGADTYQPSEGQLLTQAPRAVYTGPGMGAAFSPVDEEGTNYIVISGSITLMPLPADIPSYKELKTKKWVGPLGPVSDDEVVVTAHTMRGDKCFYCGCWWKADAPGEEPYIDVDEEYGLWPLTGHTSQRVPYSYSAIGDSSDRLHKVSVLACMLVIGGKCLVEKPLGDDLGTGIPGTGNGEPQDFVWREYKTLAQYQASDPRDGRRRYYAEQCFTIGFDPKVGDYLVGTEFQIQRNFDPNDAGIDAEGTGIPIRLSDALSGDVQFTIIGPVNYWHNNVYIAREPDLFHHTEWASEWVPVLSHVESIQVKDFEVKVYSDSGQIGKADDGKDIVYMSDTKENFVNRKDDLEFRLCSALTTEECRNLGVANSVKLSTPIDTSTGLGVKEIWTFCGTSPERAKAEQIYVDSHYRECHAPRVEIEANIIDGGGDGAALCKYRHPAFGNRFFVLGMGRNLMEGTLSLKLREISNDD